MATTIDPRVVVNDDSGTPGAPVGDGDTVDNDVLQALQDAVDGCFLGDLEIGGDFVTPTGALQAASATIAGLLSAVTAAFSGAVTMASTLVVTGMATFTAGLKERGRATALGEWIPVAFNTANFTIGSGGVFWGVTAPNQVDYRYTLVGKTMTLSFYIQNTIVAGSSHLHLAVPDGYTCASQNTNNVIDISDAGGGHVVGLAVAATGNNYILLTSNLGGGVFTDTSSASNTTVRGQITFEIS